MTVFYLSLFTHDALPASLNSIFSVLDALNTANELLEDAKDVVNGAVDSCVSFFTDLIVPKMASPAPQPPSKSKRTRRSRGMDRFPPILGTPRFASESIVAELTRIRRLRDSAVSSAPASKLSPSAAIYHPPVGCANADAGTPQVQPHQNSRSARGEDAPPRESEFIVDGPAKIIQYRRRLFILAHHRNVAIAKQLPIGVSQHHQVDHYDMLGPCQPRGGERVLVCSCGFNPASLSTAELCELLTAPPGDCSARIPPFPQAIHRG